MITEFKISYNNGKTYPQYISTLEAFFYSYANPSCTTQRSYKNVSTQDISKFLDEKQHAIDLHSGRKINKKTSLNNSYSHISSFYKFLFEQGEITEIPIETKRKAALNHYPNMPLNRHTADIKPTDIESMINTLRNSRNPQRNITIFSLCAYLGISRNDIYNLNWNCVFEYDAEYPHIVIEGREIPLCNLLIKNFSYLRNKRNINTHTLEEIPVFVSGKSNSNRLSESAINDIFDIFKKNSTEENDKWAKMCPQLLRFSLIEKLFHFKFSLEDIIYITGIDISNIGNYIPYAEIITNYNPYEQKSSYLLSEKLKKDHPYAYIFK